MDNSSSLSFIESTGGFYPHILPRIVGCKKCGQKFTLKKRQMYFHCGTALTLLLKETNKLHSGEQDG